MAGGLKKVGYCSETHMKEISFQPKDLSWAAGLNLRGGLRHTVPGVRGVLGAPPPQGSTLASWASHCCSNWLCMMRVSSA